MEDERIEAVNTWPEPQSVRDIQVFIGFANFYRRFIQGFSRIAAPLTSMLKTTSAVPPTSSPTSVGRPGGADNEEVVGSGGRVNIEKSSKSKKLGFTNAQGTEPNSGSGFLTPEARLAFTRLRKAFPILHHFDPERHMVPTGAIHFGLLIAGRKSAIMSLFYLYHLRVVPGANS